MSRALWWVLLLLPLACSGGSGVRIGAKSFEEQEILAELLDGLLVAEGITTRPIHYCSDTFDCERSLQRGEIDVMVEYTGTAFNLLGEPPPEDGDAIERLDELYRPLGVRWLVPLGFDNGYVWLLPTRRAEIEGIHSLSDLAAHPEPLRVAVPQELLARPRDGLTATARRYGLTLADEPVIRARASERLEAVVRGEADVAVVYGTDPSATDLGLTALADDLAFLPDYSAAVLAREDALDRTSGLAAALDRLRGRIDAETMRELNRAVAIEGETSAVVAARFLERSGLGEESTAPETRRKRLVIATDDPALRSAFGPPVLVGSRTVFPDRAVRLESTRSVLDAIANGRARFGIVGVEAFFETDRKGELRRTDELEALTVLGERLVHLVVAGTGDPHADPWAGRIGYVGNAGGHSIGAAILKQRGLTGVELADTDAVLSALGDGIDAALVVVAPGDERIVTALRGGARLAEVTPGAADLTAYRFALPYLRPARLPASTYAEQPEPIETFGAQVVLAGPSSAQRPGHQAAGPAGALPGGGPPSPTQLEALGAALGTGEAPDPSVPSAFSLGSRHPEAGQTSTWVDTLLNVFVIAFCAWLVVIVGAPTRPR